MSKKEFYKDIYHHKYHLLFENIVHIKVKTSSVVKGNEKVRIQKIINEISKFNENERLVIYKEHLKLFSSPYQDNLYFIIPQEISEKQVQQAVRSFNSKKNKKKRSQGTVDLQNKEERGVIKKVENPFVEKVENQLNINSTKELLKPRVEMTTEKDLSENKLLELPAIHSNKAEIKKIKSVTRFKGNLNPGKKVLTVTLRERNRYIVNSLKELYDNKCQVCGQKLKVGYKEFYSEVHHIQPLGKHNGPDIQDNMIVVCPNHHTLLDKGTISIDIAKKKVIHFLPEDELNGKSLLIKHRIRKEYIDYHDENIFLRQKDNFNSSRKVNYSDTVLFSDGENAEEVTLESFINRSLMNNMQRMLLNKSEGEKFTFNGFEYRVLKIKDIN
ncbi:HNH endonuclease [Planococcus shenhongbingii]|uniref:HNH endonuclease n=1 Tax=Planococcus shenhongbingii TaxID=3058398 RepID=A0ABT8NCK6_9BACL|nr:HNH endonuclease [Planococcus sp. N017]MDN7245571.1 HNH endonuclease [Planococcus sp. N017]